MIAILGDIHSNYAALKTVLGYCAGIGVNEYYTVGDIVGYYANPNECIELLQERGVVGVMGNHDSYVLNDSSLDQIKLTAQAAIQWTRKNLNSNNKTFLGRLPYIRKIDSRIPFRLVHSSLCQPYLWEYIKSMADAINVLTLQDTPVCFYGHTHTATAFAMNARVVGGAYESLTLECDGKYLINVGSVGQPRDGGSEARVLLFDVDKSQISLKRLAYDPTPTIANHRRAGLPEELLNYFT
jgi:predicted phosphodiesterase